VTEQTKQKNATSKRSTASRHGLGALKARVSLKGLSAIDARTVAARSLIAWRSELLRDLGGEESISAQRLTLVDMAVRARLFLDHLDSYLLAQSSLINRRSKRIIAALRERQQLADGLARVLGQLGLDRVSKDAGALPPEWIEKVKPHEAESEPEKVAQ
jgi:hypothetical protein